MSSQIKTARKKPRQDALTDLSTLQALAGTATRQAREKARQAGIAVTFIENGRLMQRDGSGQVEELREIADKPKVSLKELLCQA